MYKAYYYFESFHCRIPTSEFKVKLTIYKKKNMNQKVALDICRKRKLGKGQGASKTE